MKNTVVLAGMTVLLGLRLFAQSITLQPYLTLEWDPVCYDPVSGATAGNYRAFNLNKAGLKVTGVQDRAAVHIDIRGIPPGGDSYNQYDDKSFYAAETYTRPVYSAWGKYRFTKTGAIWGGKFKPNFGPKLFDSSHFGIGWQQKIAGAHTLSGYILQPSVTINTYTPQGWWIALPADRGIRFLLLEEYSSRTFGVSGGAAYDYLGNGRHRIYVNASTEYRGISNLTLSAEAALAVYTHKEKTILKDVTKITEAENTGLGFGLYFAAEYRFPAPLTLGTSFTLVNPLAGAKQCMPEDGVNIFGLAEGQFNNATLGVYLKYLPVKSFYIQPQVNVKMANLINRATPTNGTVIGRQAGIDFRLSLHWEPAFTFKPTPGAASRAKNPPPAGP